MELPRFLIGYNSEWPDHAYIYHNVYPRFVIEIPSEEVEWIDIPEKQEDPEILNELTHLVQEALDFFDTENA